MSQIERVGRYRIVSELGRGAMGVVYRAEDSVIGREVALKVVRRPGPKSSPTEHEQYARFLREARAAGTLLHPNVVAVFDVGEDPEHDVSYIAMELVRGDNLEQLLERRERLPIEQIRSIALQVLTALEAAHATGVVHRDIKPANLLLTEDGTVKVADFGIAKLQNAQMTTDGTLLGSPKYMSPEQARSADVDHRTDLFSLGTVLYELATLRPAFPGEKVIEVLQRVVQETPAPPRSVAPDLPVWLDAAIVRAMAKRPDERFASAAAMREALAPDAASAASSAPATDVTRTIPTGSAASPPRATPPPATGQTDRPAGPASRVSWIVAAAAVVLGIGLGFALSGGDEATEPVATNVGDGERRPAERAPEASGEPADASVAAERALDGALDGALDDAATVLDDTRAAAAETASDLAGEARVVPPAGLPIVTAVEHDHRIGSCKGVLRVFEEHVEYDSYDRDKDDRVWGFDDIKEMTVSSDGKIHMAVREADNTTLGLLDRRYNFTPTRDPLPHPALEYVLERVRQGSG